MTGAARLRDLSTLALLAAIVVAVALVGTSAGESLERTTTEALILLVAVVGFSVFVTNSGVMSFGHVAFMSVGAYAGALLSMDPIIKQSVLVELPGALAEAQLAPYVACLVGGLVAALLALVLAVPLMRLSGISAALTSFALLQVIYVVERQWRAVTNGASGIDGIPMAADVPTAAATAIGAIAVALGFQRSRWGARLRASREDEVAARAIGIDVRLERSIAFVLSAFVLGVAGGLYAQLVGSITPETLYLTTTFLLVVMLTVGGQLSLSGAVVGAVFVAVVGELLRRVEAGAEIGPVFVDGPLGLSQVGLALILLVTLILRPAGLMGGRELALGRDDDEPDLPGPAPAAPGARREALAPGRAT